MTVRLEPAARRKVERLAAERSISMNAALNLLVHQAPGAPAGGRRRRRYRLRPRKVGFGFDIARATALAADVEDARLMHKLRGQG